MKLEVICAWCQKHLSFKECANFDESLPRITHSICQVCSAKVLEDLKKSDGKTTDNEQPKSTERRI